MKIRTDVLIKKLKEETQEHIDKAAEWKTFALKTLNSSPNQQQWSALQCIEHLNLYSNYYNPEIQKAMEAQLTNTSDTFKSGVLGNYFVKMMLPKEKMKKMKTFKDKNPAGKSLDLAVLDRFIAHQTMFLDLLQMAENKDLTKTKTGISISKRMKLRLGDTFRFIVAHNERHIQQAERALGVK